MEQEIVSIKKEISSLKSSVYWALGVIMLIVSTGTGFTFLNTAKIAKNEIRSLTNEEHINILIEKAVSEDRMDFQIDALRNLLDKVIAISEGDEKKLEQANKEYDHLINMSKSKYFGITYRGE